MPLPRPTDALLVGLLSPLFFTTGCSTAGTAATAGDEFSRHIAALHQGMTKDEVRALFGEPEQTKPLSDISVHAERWLYSQRIRVNTTMKVTGTHEVPRYNPTTDQVETVHESSYAPIHQYALQELHLLWAGDKLLRWEKTEKPDGESR